MYTHEYVPMGYPTYWVDTYWSVSRILAAGRLSMIQLWWYWRWIACNCNWVMCACAYVPTVCCE